MKTKKATTASAGVGLLCPSLDALEEIFDGQYGDLPCGGFLNPTVADDDGDTILFRCFYNNYDNEEDAWHYEFTRSTGDFCAA